jgi:SpoVK/Ycf46/Vps4 family AAA+-type ATPase
MGQQWGVPVLKLSLKDCKAQGNALVGQAQAKLQEALARAEAASPCILFIDEVDKDLDAAAGPSGDSGTSIEMVGALLEWMNDHTTPVFTVLTANNVSKLTRSFPELFAAHRLDEKFFFNLPTPSERRAILNAHLNYYESKLSGEQLDELVNLTQGFISSELELVIRSSALVCLDKGMTEIDFGVLVQTIKDHVPFTASPEAAQTIAELQAWAHEGGVKYGSIPESFTPTTKTKKSTARKAQPLPESSDIQIQLD